MGYYNMKKITSVMFLVLLILVACDKTIILVEPPLSETATTPDNHSINDEISKEDFKIYDVHEQIATLDQIPRFLAAMDKAEIDKIVLLGSPDATFSLEPGFVNYQKNNRELMKMAQAYPDRFIIFPTIDPGNLDLETFKSYINEGAKGLRLFSGQFAYFYRFIGPVNRTELYPVLQYSQDNNLPVMFNMNPGKGTLQAEFEDILQRYPDIKIVCPHFCLSSIKSERLEYLMDTYPNLYTDISFGHFFEDGLKRISGDVSKFKRIMNKYQDRMLFGTDMVVTDKTGNSSDWMYNLTMCYRDMLEKENYDCIVKIGRVFNVNLHNVSGLQLDKKILEKIYYKNPKKWLGLD